jgi:hypothetical protein
MSLACDERTKERDYQGTGDFDKPHHTTFTKSLILHKVYCLHRNVFPVFMPLVRIYIEDIDRAYSEGAII